MDISRALTARLFAPLAQLAMGSLTHFVGIRPALVLFGTLAVAAGLFHRRRLRQAATSHTRRA